MMINRSETLYDLKCWSFEALVRCLKQLFLEISEQRRALRSCIIGSHLICDKWACTRPCIKYAHMYNYRRNNNCAIDCIEFYRRRQSCSSLLNAQICTWNKKLAITIKSGSYYSDNNTIPGSGITGLHAMIYRAIVPCNQLLRQRLTNLYLQIRRVTIFFCNEITRWKTFSILRQESTKLRIDYVELFRTPSNFQSVLCLMR